MYIVHNYEFNVTTDYHFYCLIRDGHVRYFNFYCVDYDRLDRVSITN